MPAEFGPWQTLEAIRSHLRDRDVSTRHESRVLVAVLVAVSALGPVVSGLIPHAVGPLAVLRAERMA